MKTSIKKLNIFAQVSSAYLTDNAEKTKLKIAIQSFQKQLPDIFEEYNFTLSLIDVNHANEDANGSVLYTEEPNGARKYEFSRANLILRDKERRELFLSETVEVIPFISASIPNNLHANLKEIFSGFVIK